MYLPVIHYFINLCFSATGDSAMNEYDNDKSWDKEEKQFEVEQKKKKPRQRSTTTSDFLNLFFNFTTI